MHTCSHTPTLAHWLCEGRNLTQNHTLEVPWGLRSLGGAVLRERETVWTGLKGTNPRPAPLPWPLNASPSRDSDSRIMLQVEAISEMDCHSSSRASLPASDMTAC